jgi:8-oxo-dGTP pyrophosphatase MutT (NUDIX family)
MSTIHEHEVRTLSESSEGAAETREHKVYKIHCEPQHFAERATGLSSVKEFLLSLPLGEQSQWAFTEPPSVEESSDVDTADGLLAKCDLGISLKLEKNTAERKKLLVLKIKGVDPVVIGRHKFACLAKKFVLRQDLVFSWSKSVVTKSWKAKVKYNRDLVTFGQVYELFQGLREVAGIPPEARLAYTRTTAAFKLTCPSIGLRPVVRAQVAIHYPTENDALAGTASFASSLSLRIRKGSSPTEWMEASRRLYQLFFAVMAPSKLSYKGPVLKAPSVQTELKLTREYALFLQASKFQDRDEAVKRFSEFLTLHGGFKSVDVSNTRDRVLEHFSLDTPFSTLKDTDSMQEAGEERIWSSPRFSFLTARIVIKFERNADTRVASVTCKYKGFDRELVAAFPVRVSPLYQSSAKLELDVHPTFARNAISLVARVPYDIRITSFHDIEAIFPGFLAFSGIEPWQPVVVRMYKVKYEICKQILNLPCGKAAVGKFLVLFLFWLTTYCQGGCRSSTGRLRTRGPLRACAAASGSSGCRRTRAGSRRCTRRCRCSFTRCAARPTTTRGPPPSRSKCARPCPRFVIIACRLLFSLHLLQLEDTTLPVQRTCGLIVLSRAEGDAAAPWRVLLLRRAEPRQSLSGSKWDVPKGKMDPTDASELTAAFRELTEETGLAPEAVQLVLGKEGPLRYVAHRFPRDENGKTVKKTFVLFLGLAKPGVVVSVSEEHSGFIWKPWDGRSEISLKSAMFETCLQGLKPFLPPVK